MTPFPLTMWLVKSPSSRFYPLNTLKNPRPNSMQQVASLYINLLQKLFYSKHPDSSPINELFLINSTDKCIYSKTFQDILCHFNKHWSRRTQSQGNLSLQYNYICQLIISVRSYLSFYTPMSIKPKSQIYKMVRIRTQKRITTDSNDPRESQIS